MSQTESPDPPGAASDTPTSLDGAADPAGAATATPDPPATPGASPGSPVAGTRPPSPPATPPLDPVARRRPEASRRPAGSGDSRRSLSHPSLYFNREISWLQFNERVLAEALDRSNPLLERIKFLGIFSSNLDEFFMIRVSGLRRQLARGVLEAPPDKMTPSEQLAAIRQRLVPSLAELEAAWTTDLLARLREEKIHVLPYSELKSKQRKLLRRHFRSEIFPALTPLAFDPGHPFPHISNLSVNLAVVIHDPGHGERFARVKVPHVFPRLLRIPSEEKADSYERLGLTEPRSTNFVWLEEMVAANLDLLFPGYEVVSAHAFRVTRDADFEIEEDEASDLMTAVEEVVGQRFFGSAVRLEIDERMPELIRDILIRNLQLQPYQVYPTELPVGLADLMELAQLERPALRDAPFVPHTPPVFHREESIFSTIRRHDRAFYHPYDSFGPVIDFVRAAARDPRVLAIKQTLYRVGPDSPIVAALREARENGKQVAALVELKARFDEANNITWARSLEEAGVHVVYGLVGLKTHAKVCMVVRRERDGITRYLHLGTGNYNPVTARIYADLGVFTRDPDIAEDISDLFNSLTGYSQKERYRKLLVAPETMRRQLLAKIDREIEVHKNGGEGYLAFKMNSLVDQRCIQALYRASNAGVRVDLDVRGICCLRPGVPGVSENIRVRSIVGRFLEHARAYYFRNGDDEELYLGSADLMPRNLNGRVEVLFPVEDPKMRAALRDDVLFLHRDDNVQAWELGADGEYTRLEPGPDEAAVDSQAILLERPGSWHWED